MAFKDVHIVSDINMLHIFTPVFAPTKLCLFVSDTFYTNQPHHPPYRGWHCQTDVGAKFIFVPGEQRKMYPLSWKH